MSDTEKDAVLSDEAPVDDEVVSKTLTSVWKRFIVRSRDAASAENETKRAMQSRHLMMIGEYWFKALQTSSVSTAVDDVIY